MATEISRMHLTLTKYRHIQQKLCKESVTGSGVGASKGTPDDAKYVTEILRGEGGKNKNKEVRGDKTRLIFSESD